MRISRLLCVLPLLLIPTASAQEEPVPPAFVRGTPESFDPDADLPKLIRMQVEFIELPHEKLTEILEGPEATDSSKLRQQVKELIGKKEGKVLETIITTGKSGQRFTSQSTDEFIYPTEYEGMEIIEIQEEKSSVPKAAKTPFVPTAFETKDLGSKVDFEPNLHEDGTLVELRLVPEMAWHTGNIVWAEDKDPTGNVSRIEMPRFYSLKVDTSVTCMNGKPMFVAAVSPKSDDGRIDTSRKVMIFVKCDVTTIK